MKGRHIVSGMLIKGHFVCDCWLAEAVGCSVFSKDEVIMVGRKLSLGLPGATAIFVFNQHRAGALFYFIFFESELSFILCSL